MIQQIIFTVVAFVLFIYVLSLKMIKKNDTTYLIILGIQAIGILLNLLRISADILNGTVYTIILYVLCIVIPISVFLLELKGLNVSELLMIAMAKTYLLIGATKRSKKVLIELVTKYKDSYLGHKMLACIYEKEGGLRKAIDEYVKALDIRKNDYKSYYKISVLLNELDKKEEAIEMLTALLKSKPEMYDASKLLRTDTLGKKRF